LASLPPYARLRCAAVCRGWRASLLDANVWTRLEVGKFDPPQRWIDDASLVSIAARAQGRLEVMDVSECYTISDATLRAVVAANAATLRELRACKGLLFSQALAPATAEALLQSASALRELRADVECDSVADALRVLRNEPPFELLHIEALDVTFDAPSRTVDAVRALAAAVATHASLRALRIFDAPLDDPAAVHALADALLAHGGVQRLALEQCSLGPTCAPALARIAGSGSVLHTLRFKQFDTMFDEHAAELLGSALRANHALHTLTFTHVDIWSHVSRHVA
jgi:hypothetical protein